LGGHGFKLRAEGKQDYKAAAAIARRAARNIRIFISLHGRDVVEGGGDLLVISLYEIEYRNLKLCESTVRILTLTLNIGK
jgi:hypothetical protein